MKYHILTFLLVAAFLSSCSDFLDVTTESKPTADYFKTDKDATAAMDACYQILNMEETFGRNLFWEQAGGGDDFIYGRTRGADQNNLANFTCIGRESSLVENWEAFYQHMNRANWIVFGLSKKESLTPIESNRLGEAYFMRAFCHFYIAYRYGRVDLGVPYVAKEESDVFSVDIPDQQPTVMANYGLIVQDLEKAERLLPFFENYNTADYGRAHKAAAWGLMVRVYAYWAQYDPGKWAVIPPLVDKLEQEGNRGLLDNFAAVFTIANNWSKEHIWSVNSSGHNYAGSMFPGVVLENKGWGLFNGWGYFKPTLGLYNEYVPGDERRGVTILAYNDEFVFFGAKRRFYSTADLGSGFQLAKYMEPFTYGTIDDGVGKSETLSPNGDRPTTDLNMPLIRHAEMVLFKAEALLIQGRGAEAATELNRLTNRAGLGNVYTIATMDDLKHERRCELAGEFTDRFMDLKRWQEWDRLSAPKKGRAHADRSDPTSVWVEDQIWPPKESGSARVFDPLRDIVFPYNPDEVVKSNDKLKQNPGY